MNVIPQALAALSPVDAAALARVGDVFAVFDDQDSGCLSFGVSAGGRRWFVKTAAQPPAVASLHRAVALQREVAHPAIVPLRAHHLDRGRLTLVYDWVDGQVLYHPTARHRPDRSEAGGPMARFRRLPVATILDVLQLVLDAHRAVEDAGYVAVDLYDGCLLYDFAASRMLLVDLDEYRPGPFALDVDRLPGSRRYMPPEHLRRGALAGTRSTVFQLGRMLRLLLDGGDDEQAWRGTTPQLAVIEKATWPDPAHRHPSVHGFLDGWRQACR